MSAVVGGGAARSCRLCGGGGGGALAVRVLAFGKRPLGVHSQLRRGVESRLSSLELLPNLVRRRPDLARGALSRLLHLDPRHLVRHLITHRFGAQETALRLPLRPHRQPQCLG